MPCVNGFENLSKLEENLGYTFKNIHFLEVGVTHSSYANEAKGHIEYNERQEFLGDAVLSIIVSDYIFENYTELPEGELTKLRASLVCEKSLCEFSTELHMGEFLRLGHGEELMGGRERPSILADAFEAVLAAIYLDGGIEPATKFVLGFVKRSLSHVENVPFKDYKTLLQQIGLKTLLQREKDLPEIHFTHEEAPVIGIGGQIIQKLGQVFHILQGL